MKQDLILLLISYFLFVRKKMLIRFSCWHYLNCKLARSLMHLVTLCFSFSLIPYVGSALVDASIFFLTYVLRSILSHFLRTWISIFLSACMPNNGSTFFWFLFVFYVGKFSIFTVELKSTNVTAVSRKAGWGAYLQPGIHRISNLFSVLQILVFSAQASKGTLLPHLLEMYKC